MWFESRTAERGLIRQITLYEFKLGNYVVEAAKNICGVKSKDINDYSTVTKRLKNFRLDCKKREDPAGSDRPTSANSKVALQAGPMSKTWIVSGEPGTLQSSMFRYELGKSLRSWGIVPHVSKILQNFWLTLTVHWSSRTLCTWGSTFIINSSNFWLFCFFYYSSYTRIQFIHLLSYTFIYINANDHALLANTHA